ncbi:MAG: RIP metalloprotease RseP [Paenibacillaceae bacterium]
MFFILVGIHEWGHFYFAKRAGILVREFAIGFGPRLFTYKKGETRYTIRLLPVGGFVRMAGEDPEIIQIQPGQTIGIQTEPDNRTVSHIYLDQLDSRQGIQVGVVETIDIEQQLTLRMDVSGHVNSLAIHPQAMMIGRGKETQIAPLNRQFGGKTVGQRALSIFAGPMMNFILAFLLFIVYVTATGIPIHVKLSMVEDKSVAQNVGLEPGDLILSVNGQPIHADTQLFRDLIAQSPDSEMLWNIRRGDQEQLIKLTPRAVDGVGKVGIGISSFTRNASLVETFTESGTLMWSFTKEIFIGFKKLILLQFKLDDLGGPIKIVEVTGEAVALGLTYFVLWTALLSLYLGIFNLLPFPALDGSRLLFLGIEALRGKPVDPNRESLVHFIGFAMLMMLMLAVTYNDIVNLFKG